MLNLSKYNILRYVEQISKQNPNPLISYLINILNIIQTKNVVIRLVSKKSAGFLFLVEGKKY